MRRLWILVGAVALVAAGTTFSSGARAGTSGGGNGPLFAVSGGDIVAFAADGSGLHTVIEDASEPSVLPDYSGGRIAFTRAGDIWVADGDGSNEQQVTSGGADDHEPSWMSTGTSIVFTRSEGGVDSLALVDATPNATVTLLNEGSDAATRSDARVVYRSESLCSTPCLGTMAPGLDPPSVLVDDPDFPDPREPRWDPHEGRVIFVYDDDPDPGVYGAALAAFTLGTDGPVQLIPSDGSERHSPLFSPDAQRVAYLEDGQVLVTPAPDGSPAVAVPGVSVDGDGGLEWQALSLAPGPPPPSPPLPPAPPTPIPRPPNFTG
jgi:dipeptidyl aminopeptidase/acylaminoacyl peptidase